MPFRPNAALRRLKERAFPGAEAEQAMAFQDRLDESQWMSTAQVEAYQLHHLKRLVSFATRNIPAYRSRISAAKVDAATSLAAALSEIPILSRSTLAADPAQFKAVDLPPGHSFSGSRKSSGTSGLLVEVDVTNVVYAWQNALTLRSYLWAGWDFSRVIAGVRVEKKGGADYPQGATAQAWDAPSVFPFATGSAAHLTTATSLEDMWEWLQRIKPAYLLTYPSIVRTFAARAEREKKAPCHLHGVATVGESVDTELRDSVSKFLGTELYDRYSSQEAGLIAGQCPTNRRYHVQDEAVIVEVLREDGTAAGAGESGRVVVTTLHNYATPLLRYDIGDVAEVGTACSCGRGLRTLNRIVGRQRNIFRLRDGRTFWPAFGVRAFSRYMPVRQHQIRQLDYEKLEVVIATSTPTDAVGEEKLRADMRKRMPIAMDIAFKYVEDIPREAGGKYQEFVCLIPAD